MALAFSPDAHLGHWHRRQGLDDGSQLFVIGDVHGQAGALAATLDTIAKIPREAERRRLVFLGDLIDRGPQSIAAMELATTAADRATVDEVILLPGNHELMLLDALDDPQRFMGDWLDNGGEALIAEAAPARPLRLLQEFADCARRIVPPKFLAVMRSAPSHILAGDLLMVHAGLSPEEDPSLFLDLPRKGAYGAHWAWIRQPFLDWRGGWGPERQWLVVHGHSPAVRRAVTPTGVFKAANRLRTHARICLDAGAAFGLPQVAWAEFLGQRFRLGLCRTSDDGIPRGQK